MGLDLPVCGRPLRPQRRRRSAEAVWGEITEYNERGVRAYLFHDGARGRR
jgi:hypothetical protein